MCTEITIPATPEGLETAFKEIVSEEYSRYYELQDEIRKARVYELSKKHYERTDVKLPKDLKQKWMERFNLSESQVERAVYDRRTKREESEEIPQMEMCFNSSHSK